MGVVWVMGFYSFCLISYLLSIQSNTGTYATRQVIILFLLLWASTVVSSKGLNLILLYSIDLMEVLKDTMYQLASFVLSSSLAFGKC
jgi:hypothetical protein